MVAKKNWLIMVYKIDSVLQNSLAIAVVLLLTNVARGSSTEYVFTAPPEVGKEVVEIPTSETEYPLYECDPESDEKLDSHDCVCSDCEERLDSSLEQSELDSKSEAEQR